MRQLLIEDIDNFKSRFEKGFHDAHFLSIEYDFNAGNPPHHYARRVTVKISTPDWKKDPDSRPPRRIVLILEMEGYIDYCLLKKQEIGDLVKINDIDVIITGEFIILDFLPYHDDHPLRGRHDIYKHYEKERLSSLFILKGKECYWSVIE